MEMGADDFISKRIDDIELLKAIQTRLKKYDVLHCNTADDMEAGMLIKDFGDSCFLNINIFNHEAKVILKNSYLYSENCRPKYLYFLKKEKVKVYRRNDDGKRIHH